MSPKFEDIGYDLLLYILDIFRYDSDYGSLYNCSLVCERFNAAVSPLLYRRIVLSPPFRPVLNLRDKGALNEPSQFASARLPQYAQLVQELTISGFLSPRPPPLNTFSTTLVNAVLSFVNLRALELTPTTYHEETFSQALQALRDISSLESLSVNSCCTDAHRAPLLTQIKGLTRLVLYDPTRVLLDLLPGWLSLLSKTLKKLYLKGNCGSITPGVLMRFVSPPLQGRLRALSLGLSYSLTHDHVFNFLNNFPELEELELRYYWQLKEPTVHLSLKRLRKFTVLYTHTQVKREVLSICKWIRKVVSYSPLEDLRVICDGKDNEANSGANIGFDSIVDHLSKKHARTLRFLDLRSSYVGVVGLRALFSSCLQLEECYVSAGKEVLAIFEQLYGRLTYLRMAGFELRNVNRNKCKLDHDRVRDLMMNGPPAFRKVIMNETEWKGFWASKSEGRIEFHVERCLPVKPPWGRE